MPSLKQRVGLTIPAVIGLFRRTQQVLHFRRRELNQTGDLADFRMLLPSRFLREMLDTLIACASFITRQMIHRLTAHFRSCMLT